MNMLFLILLGTTHQHPIAACISFQARPVANPHLGDDIKLALVFTNRCSSKVTLFTRLSVTEGDLRIEFQKEGCTWQTREPHFSYSEEDYVSFMKVLKPGRSYTTEHLLQGDGMSESGILQPGTYHIKVTYSAERVAAKKQRRRPLFKGTLTAETELHVQPADPNLLHSRLKSLRHWQAKGTLDDESMNFTRLLAFFRYVPNPEATAGVAEIYMDQFRIDAVDVLVHQGARSKLEQLLTLCKKDHPRAVYQIEEGLRRLDHPPPKCPPCRGVFDYPLPKP